VCQSRPRRSHAHFSSSRATRAARIARAEREDRVNRASRINVVSASAVQLGDVVAIDNKMKQVWLARVESLAVPGTMQIAWYMRASNTVFKSYVRPYSQSVPLECVLKTVAFRAAAVSAATNSHGVLRLSVGRAGRILADMGVPTSPYSGRRFISGDAIEAGGGDGDAVSPSAEAAGDSDGAGDASAAHFAESTPIRIRPSPGLFSRCSSANNEDDIVLDESTDSMVLESSAAPVTERAIQLESDAEREELRMASEDLASALPARLFRGDGVSDGDCVFPNTVRSLQSCFAGMPGPVPANEGNSSSAAEASCSSAAASSSSGGASDNVAMGERVARLRVDLDSAGASYSPTTPCRSAHCNFCTAHGCVSYDALAAAVDAADKERAIQQQMKEARRLIDESLDYSSDDTAHLVWAHGFGCQVRTEEAFVSKDSNEFDIDLGAADGFDSEASQLLLRHCLSQCTSMGLRNGSVYPMICVETGSKILRLLAKRA
jgi:hypothetical protein